MPPVKEKPAIQTLDDLFGIPAAGETVQSVPTNLIDDFPDHPFHVKQDEAMAAMVESIQENGIRTPLIVRPKEDKRYEVVSGHRRRFAAALAGLEALPCIVREMTRDEAIIAMIDANLQREVILPSEKAFSYKMKLEALKRQGKRTDLTSRQVVGKLESADIVGEQTGDSGRQIQRFIRLTELHTELLALVDSGRIKFNPAVYLATGNTNLRVRFIIDPNDKTWADKSLTAAFRAVTHIGANTRDFAEAELGAAVVPASVLRERAAALFISLRGTSEICAEVSTGEVNAGPVRLGAGGDGFFPDGCSFAPTPGCTPAQGCRNANLWECLFTEMRARFASIGAFLRQINARWPALRKIDEDGAGLPTWDGEAWPGGGGMVGPQGPPGADGAPGTQGPPGPPGGAPQNVISTLPNNPQPNTAYFTLNPAPVSVIAAVEYTAGPKDVPMPPPAPIPGGDNVSFMGGVGMGFAYDTVANIFIALNGLTGDAFTVEDGGDNYMGIITTGTDTYIAAWLYFFGQTTINGTTYEGHAALNLDLSMEGGNTAKDFFTGAWTFGQADIDSGAVAAFMDTNFGPGWIYHDGTDWLPLTGS